MAETGLLAVPPPQAARAVLAAHIGVTLVLVADAPDEGETLSAEDAAIDEAGGLLGAAGAVDEDRVASRHERERSVTTYMGNGLAIPHGTDAAKDHIRSSALTFTRYAEPLDWNGQEVRFVIGIAGKGREHLGILAKVAKVFGDTEQVARLEAAHGGRRPGRPREGERMSTAVHVGAGNIGRGFVGLLLHEAGYDLVVADVAAPLIDALASTPSYTVHEVGEGGRDHVVDGCTAVNSATDEARLVERLGRAELVTTAVGPNVLKFVAPAIARGIAARPAGAPRQAVTACENAVKATDLLEQEVRGAARGPGLDDAAVDARTLFANTAVGRIVPDQAHDSGLDVLVEPYAEWAVEKRPFGDVVQVIPGVTSADSLDPYIERKLFTVNTGHAAAADFGRAAGKHQISDALADPAVREKVEAVLQETKALLVAKRGFEEQAQEADARKILGRFANEHLPDTVERVGRAPLRKLGRHQRFVSPAAELAERGTGREALLGAMSAVLRFDVPDGAEARTLGELLRGPQPEEQLAAQLTGPEPGHPLFGEVVGVVAAVREPVRG